MTVRMNKKNNGTVFWTGKLHSRSHRLSVTWPWVKTWPRWASVSTALDKDHFQKLSSGHRPTERPTPIRVCYSNNWKLFGSTGNHRRTDALCADDQLSINAIKKAIEDLNNRIVGHLAGKWSVRSSYIQACMTPVACRSSCIAVDFSTSLWCRCTMQILWFCHLFFFILMFLIF